MAHVCHGSVMLRAYEVIIVEVVRSHMPFSVRFAVACMRGIGYHVAHAFSIIHVCIIHGETGCILYYTYYVFILY